MAEIAIIVSFIFGLKLTDIVYKSQHKMGNHDKTVRKTKKNKRKNTFNKYGKNTARSTRIKLAAIEAQEKNSKIRNAKKVKK